MADILKGNFETERQAKDDAEAGEDLESRFERAALKRLGGSIAFVKKKKVTWDLDAEEE